MGIKSCLSTNDVAPISYPYKNPPNAGVKMMRLTPSQLMRGSFEVVVDLVGGDAKNDAAVAGTPIAMAVLRYN